MSDEVERNTLFKEVQLGFGQELYPELVHRTVERAKWEMESAVDGGGWTPMGLPRIKIVVELDVEREVPVDPDDTWTCKHCGAVTPKYANHLCTVGEWLRGCGCYGGPHGGYTCDRCAGRVK